MSLSMAAENRKQIADPNWGELLKIKKDLLIKNLQEIYTEVTLGKQTLLKSFCVYLGGNGIVVQITELGSYESGIDWEYVPPNSILVGSIEPYSCYSPVLDFAESGFSAEFNLAVYKEYMDCCKELGCFYYSWESMKELRPAAAKDYCSFLEQKSSEFANYCFDKSLLEHSIS